jgi:Ca-activated chloride channel family protein
MAYVPESTEQNKARSYPIQEKSAVEYEPYYLDQAYDVERGEKDEIQAFIQVFPQDSQFNTEQYDYIAENEFLNSIDNPLSTFSIDVDTASYANLRRFLNNGQTPPADAVRIEEMINYFVYDYPQPKGEDPFSVNVEVGTCPWNPAHQLAMIGLQGKSLSADTIPQSNLVFLIDVSGSMSDANKLPLLKQGFKMMVNQLRPEETVSIVTYAGQAGVLLDSVSGADKQQILAAIDRLQSGGSTAGAQGILTAYELAKKNLIPGGNNRVILATDGDFNIGVSSDGDLVRIIEEKRQQGIFLTVLGFGMGNYKDGKMEKLADKGNGNYYYIDTEREAKKVMVRELGSTLFTIAKDVKLQIEFNPAQVKAYRLVGYENRKLNKEDFNDDTKDAGELGAGHTVTAFYEIIPAGSEEPTDIPSVDPFKYHASTADTATAHADEIMTVKLRYKQPDADVSKLIERSVTASEVSDRHSRNYEWASAVAEFGMLLRNSKFKGSASFDNVLSRARSAKGADQYGYNQELIDLVEKAKTLVPETYSTGYGFKVAE